MPDKDKDSRVLNLVNLDPGSKNDGIVGGWIDGEYDEWVS